MTRRSRSSGRWLQEHFADPFVKRAQGAGCRSRAIYKLEELDQRENLLRPGAVCLDLGAAPGAWSQYARQRVGRKGRVVATDILPMDRSGGGVRAGGLQGGGGVRADRGPAARARGRPGALGHGPQLCGVDAIDQPRSMYLAELALDMAERVLKPGGTALIKVFQGSGFRELLRPHAASFASEAGEAPRVAGAQSRAVLAGEGLPLV